MLQKMLEDAKAQGATHAMIENIGQIETVKKVGLVPIGGIRLNVTNSQNAKVLRKAGLAALFVSPELSAPRARDIGEGVLVYGRVPVMALERCVSKEQGGCEMCGKVSLCDRMDAKFPLYPTSGHRSLLFNSLPTYVCDKKKEMEMLSPLHLYLFTEESEQIIKTVVKAAKEGAPLPFATRRLFK
jgi:putative protease